MGLRELLGLPPKPKKGAAPALAATAVPEDRGPFDKAIAAHGKITSDPRFAMLSKSGKDALRVAHDAANGLAASGQFKEAAKGLSDAVGVAACDVVQAATAKQTFDKFAAAVSGAIDGARIMGVDENHVAALGARYAAIHETAKTDIVQAASDIEVMAKDLAADAHLKAAKAARDRILGEKAAVEAAASKALEIPTETPAAMQLHRQLDAAKLALIGFVGRTKYMDAVRELDRCIALTADLEAERAGIADAIKLRDAVLQARAAIDADVLKARQVFGTTEETKALVEEFKQADQQYEGAILKKEYGTAKSKLAVLKSLLPRVLDLKPEADAALQVSKDYKAALGRVRSKLAEKSGMDAVTAELKEIQAKIDAAIGAFNDLALAGDEAAATVSADGLIKLVDDYKAAHGRAGAEIAKGDEVRRLWLEKGAARYETYSKVKPIHPDAVEAVALMHDLYKDVNAALTSDDFSTALTDVKALLGCLDAVAGFAKADNDARASRSAVLAKLGKNRQAIVAAFAVRAYTPEMLALKDALKARNDELKVLNEKGDPAAMQALDDVLRIAAEIKAGMAANSAKDKEAQKNAQAAADAGAPAFRNALATAKRHLPHSQDYLDRLRAGGAALNALSVKGEHLAVARQAGLVAAISAEVAGLVPGWTTLANKDQVEAEQRMAAVGADYGAVTAYSAHSKALEAALADVTAAHADATQEVGAKAWAAALVQVERLEKAVAALKALKGEHDRLAGQKAWVDAKISAIGADVDKAIAEFALIPETQEIKGRLDMAKKQADAAIVGKDYDAARLAWENCEQLLGLWTAKEADNNKGWTQEADDVHKRWAVMKPDYGIASDMRGLTPELKKLDSAFWADNSRFWAAYSALDWPQALKILDSFEKTTAAFAAKKPDFDAALVAATQRSTTAAAEVSSLSFDDLKKKSNAEKAQYLDDLRARGDKLTDAERKLQRKLYNSLDVDPEFEALDKANRAKLSGTLRADTEVMEARSGWAAKTDDQKLAVLMKVLKAECQVYGIPAPAVRLYCEPKGSEGFFSPSNFTLNLNTHPDSGWSDYKEAVNTVVHENAHNYQAVIARRIEEGIIVEGDPEYVQGLIFAANNGPYGYVKTDETPDPDEAEANPYETQPIEAHAFDTGDGVSDDLIALPPEKGKKL